MDLENTTRRLRRRGNGVIFPYMDVARPFSRRLTRRVVLSKSNEYTTTVKLYSLIPQSINQSDHGYSVRKRCSTNHSLAI